MIKNGTITSVWDGEIEIISKATLNTKTGEISVMECSEADGLDILDREYFTDENGKEYDMCSECHQYIRKCEMVNDRVGNGLHAKYTCMGGCDD